MYESYYGFVEKPFSLTPDPKYLYRSQSHGDAFDLLQYAIRRREGFVVVTGDIGTGKTTLCRAVLEQVDRATFTALVLNPFLSEEDLLKRILQDFGVVSREDAKMGRLGGVTKQELIETLYAFLLGLVPLKASAVLIIDEAQNLPLRVLEQIRILSNLETDKEKLLQIILVGQLELQTLLRSPALRQLDQRVSIRYELKPLDRDAAGSYVSHRLAVAGGSGSVAFTAKAIDRVHALSGGIPRLINLICDRALLSGFSQRTSRITPPMIEQAAESLDLRPPHPPLSGWLTRRASFAAAAAVVLLSSVLGAGAAAYVYERFAQSVEARATAAGSSPLQPPAYDALKNRDLPLDAVLTILVGSYPTASPRVSDDVRAMTNWLEGSGLAVYYAEVDYGPGGRWHRVLAGAYADEDVARRELHRLKTAAPLLDARVVSARDATSTIGTIGTIGTNGTNGTDPR
ncbi:MAG TPA: AAA family ATPase [Vicinamibacterales bacterium]|nr:AAA family ATPase [Vicinamibacterales bacterium]